MLVERGYDVTVLERQVTIGGNARSERVDGFLMERGPTSLPTVHDHVTALSTALRLDGCRISLDDGVRHRYLTKAGRLVGVPTHGLGFITSPLLSPAARLRLLAEFFVAHRDDSSAEQSVAAFFRRRCGAEFVDRVIDPLVAGLTAARADDISIDAVFPRLVDMERKYGSLTAGALAARRNGRRMPGGRLFSWKSGIGTLPQALATRLGRRIRARVAVRRIAPVRTVYRSNRRRRDGYRAPCGRRHPASCRCRTAEHPIGRCRAGIV